MNLIERVETFTVGLPTLRDFTIAGGAVTSTGRPAVRVLVKVTASDGSVGWGEATPIPSWTYETRESIISIRPPPGGALVSTITGYLAPAAVGRPLWDLDGLVRVFDRTINRGFSIGMPLTRSAIDVACHDALARSLGVSVSQLWGRRRRDTIELAWIVAGQTPAEAAESVAAALRMARQLSDVDIAVLEQPLPANDIVGLRRLRDASPVTVAVDESLRHPTDLASASESTRR